MSPGNNTSNLDVKKKKKKISGNNHAAGFPVSFNFLIRRERIS